METHHRRLMVLQYVGKFSAERRATRSDRDACRIDSKLSVVRRQCGVPCSFTFGIDSRCRVGKEIDVEWLARLRLDRFELAAQAICREHGARHRTQTARVRNCD